MSLIPPGIRPTIPPGVVPGERRATWQSLLGKPTTIPGAGIVFALSDIPSNASATRKFIESASSSTPVWDTLLLADLPTNSSATRKFLRSVSSGAATWDTLLAADVTGDIAATRKFLRSLGSGASPGTTVWDTLTAADIAAGTFPTGTFTFPGDILCSGSAGAGLAVRDTTAYSAGVTGALLQLQGLDSTSVNANLGIVKAFALASQASKVGVRTLAAGGGAVYGVYFTAIGLNLPTLPTSAAGLATGDVWNSAGTLKVA